MPTHYLPATIQVNSGITTFINVFTIAPENQQALLDVLKSQTDSSIRKQPGFLNANFHRSLDGVSVVNYVQWTDQRSSEVIHENPEIMAGFARYQALNVKMDLRYYEVAFAVGQQAIIEPQNGVVTLISLFSTKPPHQQQALETLKQELCSFAKQQAGFVSMSLHRSLDGTRILNYTQWKASASHTIADVLTQHEPLMSLLEGACDRIETHLYEVSFAADAHRLVVQ
ncbi:antibiotic biosynthesis monooxygenase [Nostoc sp. MS1]|uniref:antibiotic biosynthesis monooxygenase n=1 Tax=Nostoc sp. MS1 TaxID=2764711 RepID=UPI001CC514C0|nr:antibiotic biosynthesis monooxygenase [Nostoc sp. MS1]BCL35271.1 hypothetical protein NSMS1_17180 [Nostoc sp. MS1]